MNPVVSRGTVSQRECPRCGQRVSGSHSACPHCGAKLPNPARVNQMALLGLLLVLIGGVAFFVMHT